MICTWCRRAADDKEQGRHEQCTGCDCRHKPPGTYQILPMEPLPGVDSYTERLAEHLPKGE